MSKAKAISMTTTTRLTLEQFLDQPQGKPYREYVCGEVFKKPMGTQQHSFLQTYLTHLLVQFLIGTPVGRAGTEWRCVFGPLGQERSYVPDLMYVARAHLTTDRFHPRAPDLAVEILSPRQPLSRFRAKIDFYLQYGVRLVWIFDPADQVVTVLIPGQEPRTLQLGDTLSGGDVLPGFSVPLREVFAQMALDPAAALSADEPAKETGA